jgi:hypothetical protein
MGDKRQRVFYNPDVPSLTGTERSQSVCAEFSPEAGLTISGYDSSWWPERDCNWEFRVTADQTDKLRKALGTKGDEDIFEVFLEQFTNQSYGFWRRFSTWFDDHGFASLGVLLRCVTV